MAPSAQAQPIPADVHSTASLWYDDFFTIIRERILFYSNLNWWGNYVQVKDLIRATQAVKESTKKSTLDLAL